MFDSHSKTIVGLERLMLEASAFDFRSHNPQKLLLKVAKRHHVEPETVGRTAYNMSVDLYRTFTPLKQTTQTMAIACVELAGRLHRQPIQELEAGKGYSKWNTTRAEVMGAPSPRPPSLGSMRAGGSSAATADSSQKASSTSSTSTRTTAPPRSSARSTRSTTSSRSASR